MKRHHGVEIHAEGAGEFREIPHRAIAEQFTILLMEFDEPQD